MTNKEAKPELLEGDHVTERLHPDDDVPTAATATGTEELRLLPWTTEDGRPCFLSSHGTGYVTELADTVEEEQLEAAGELLTEARKVLAARAWTQGELHFLAVRLAEGLSHVHRIAESRGARLPAPDDVRGRGEP